MKSGVKQQESGFWMLLGRSILVIFAVAITSLIFRTLSLQEYGLYTWVLLISQTAALIAEVGGNTATLTFIPKFLQQNAFERCQKFFVRNVAIQVATLSLIATLYYVGNQLFHGVQAPLFGLSLLLAIVFVVRDAVGGLATALFKIRALAVTQAIAAIVGFIVIYLVIHLYEPTVVRILIASSLTTMVCVLIFLAKIMPTSRSKGAEVVAQGAEKEIQLQLNRLFLVAYPPYLNALLGRFFTLYSEPFFLGLFVGFEAVGVYSLANTHIFFVIGFLSLALQQFLIAHLTTKNLHQETLSKLFELFQILFVPLAVFLFFFAERYFIAIFGLQAAFSGHIASYIAIVQLLATFTMPPWVWLSVVERGHSMIPLQIFSALVTIGWDLFLIPTYGIYGAVMAPACSFLTTLWYRLYVVKQHIGSLIFPWIRLFRVVSFSSIAALLSLLLAYPIPTPFLALPALFVLYLMIVYYLLGDAERQILRHFGFLVPLSKSSPKFHVAHILRRYSKSAWGGTEQAVTALIRASTHEGVEGIIYTTSMYDKNGTTQEGEIKVVRLPYQLPWWGLTSTQKMQLEGCGGNLLSFQLFWKLLFTPKRNLRLNLIHIHVLGRLGAIGRMVAKLRGVPYVVTIHGGYFALRERERMRLIAPGQHGIEWGRLFGALFGSHKLLQDASAIICISCEEHILMSKAYPGTVIAHIPHGIDPRPYQTATDALFRAKYNLSKAKIILTVARIDKQKNQLTLIEAFTHIRACDEKYHLVLIGPVTDSEYMAKVQGACQALPSGSYTIIPGLPPSDPHLISAYKAAAYFVLPSSHEPFGIVVLEAWAAGVPVIASSCGGLKDLLKDRINGLVIDPDDSKSIVEAISSSSELIGQIVNGGYESLRGYTIEATAKATCSLYKEISVCES